MASMILVRTSEQVYRIREALAEAGATHGAQGVAILHGLQQPHQAHMKACFMPGATITLMTTQGDGGLLPHDVTWPEGLMIPAGQQAFDLTVEFTINGAVQIRNVSAEIALA